MLLLLVACSHSPRPPIPRPPAPQPPPPAPLPPSPPPVPTAYDSVAPILLTVPAGVGAVRVEFGYLERVDSVRWNLDRVFLGTESGPAGSGAPRAGGLVAITGPPLDTLGWVYMRETLRPADLRLTAQEATADSTGGYRPAPTKGILLRVGAARRAPRLEQ
jgi:hypothetical protein